ncbi:MULTISPECIES: tellurite resistance/C4-dicarboxylate transporter family protein [Microbacterium]|uniref:Tellurite resistance/C4-dicarboxylate transporter family protein n=1 Tax=Microbacterium commune TaxID=2762219 RepID=A0ABR8W228_9MICO|nr:MULTISPECIES: tellurite resistance/C4-dicarboxylate transporter family protein [Microbacterium]MBD8011080.1 tellurite resistance/C4-dicarboxylate transporter family protein [Microbacterium commune]OIU85470.1 tellurite resistance protein permease [Microbacterium sp. AR7-10]
MNRVREAIADLAPGYFAAVMGTGIVSIGLHDLGIHSFSVVLMWLAGALYVVLWALYLWRAIAFGQNVVADLRDPEKAFAFFTVVAASGVLGVRFAREELMALAVPLFLLAGVIWVVFGYLLPWQVLMTRDGRPILARANGTWFIWAVASQSLAISMTQLHPPAGSEMAIWIGVLAVLAWSVGVVLYAAIAMLVLLRVVHYGVTPQQFDPAYWVAMGALAIAVVAGASIVGMPQTPIVDAVRPLIAATVVIFWVFCLWLIPLLVGAGVWRHGVHRVPLRYVPTLWSMVFPIGMFAVASESLARADRLPAAGAVGRVGLVIAVIVWAVVFVAMLHHAGRTVWPSRRAPSLSRADPSA